jgi:UTP--glucose-1-phosphate uridylyltransferase
MIKHAVIPAAGFGTRFLPATKAQPKEMLPLIDKPTIQYVVEEAVASGIKNILIVTGRGKRAIEDHFDRSVELEEYLKKTGKLELLEEIKQISNLADIHYVRQKDQLGLGDAVLCAEKHIDGEPFVLLLGDTITKSKVPCTRQLINIFEKTKNSVIAVTEVKREEVAKYGIIKPKAESEGIIEIESLVEKPNPQDAPSNLAIIGRYALTSKIFDQIRLIPRGKNNEIQLTDALNLLANKEKVFGFKFQGKNYDIGNKLEYAKAFVSFASHRKDIGNDFNKYIGEIVKEKNHQ